DVELKPLYRNLANNKFFNIDREERLHPSFQHELAQVASTRGEKYAGGEAMYQLGYFATRWGLPLLILALAILGWTRRIARKTPISDNQSRSGYTANLLLKMSWRVGLLVIISLALVAFKHLSPALSDEELQSAIGITFLFLFLVVPATYFVSVWWQT